MARLQLAEDTVGAVRVVSKGRDPDARDALLENVTESGRTHLFDGDAVLADSRADYTQGGATGVISERAGATTKHYHGDQISSTRGLSNSSQTITDTREYDAWGLLVSSSGSTPTAFGFVGGQGYQRDADSGLFLLGRRYYDPSIGRCISRDPIGYKGGLNLYGYCRNDPVNHADPSGLVMGWDDGLFWIVVGGTILVIAMILWLAIRNYFQNTHAIHMQQHQTAWSIMQAEKARGDITREQQKEHVREKKEGN